jgi:MinD-like ATPase involved in chromosome partitioning or flagellar assembly
MLEDKEVLTEVLEDHNCEYSDVVIKYRDSLLIQYGLGGIIDTSFYPEVFHIGGKEIRFESKYRDTKIYDMVSIDRRFTGITKEMMEFNGQRLSDRLVEVTEEEVQKYARRYCFREWIQQWLTALVKDKLL